MLAIAESEPVGLREVVKRFGNLGFAVRNLPSTSSHSKFAVGTRRRTNALPGIIKSRRKGLRYIKSFSAQSKNSESLLLEALELLLCSTSVQPTVPHAIFDWPYTITYYRQVVLSVFVPLLLQNSVFSLLLFGCYSYPFFGAKTNNDKRSGFHKPKKARRFCPTPSLFSAPSFLPLLDMSDHNSQQWWRIGRSTAIRG